MLGKQQTLEWQIGDGGDWEVIAGPLDLPGGGEAEVFGATPARRLVLGPLVRTGALFFLLGALILVDSLGRAYQAGLRQIRADIQETLDLEAWAWQSGDESLIERVLDHQAPEDWVRHMQWELTWSRRWAGHEARTSVMQIARLDLYPDFAEVQVVAVEPGEPWWDQPYRETRFYRQRAGRWLRTEPPASLWGERRSQETRFFYFDFYQRDAETVAIVAAQMDELYASMRRDVGLGPPPAGQLFRIRVMPTTDVVDWQFVEGELNVASPILVPVQANLPDSAGLIQSIVYPLAGEVTEELLRQAQINHGWQPMTEGLLLWLGQRYSAMPSAWHYNMESALLSRLARSPTLSLTFITPSGLRDWGHWDRWTRIMAAETVMEYIATAYTPAQIPVLVQAMGAHMSWEDLIQDVFDVSMDEFEVGWHAYLAVHYPTNDQNRRDEELVFVR